MAESLPRPRGAGSRGFLTLVLVGAVAWSLTSVDTSRAVLHPGGLAAFGQVVVALFRPDLSPDVLGRLASSLARTVAYAFAGLGLALVIGFPLGALASGTLGGRAGSVLQAGIRFVLAFFRSVHELIWAWLFVAAVGLSPMAAIFALGIPYGGILGRVYAELLQDVDEAPLRALRNAGASTAGVFWYGRMPMVLTEMVGYTFYRLECGLRSATIFSFVGLGGLGFQIDIALDDLDYSRAWTFVLALIGLILLVEAWSSAVRRRLVV